jgi:hypothetical protein
MTPRDEWNHAEYQCLFERKHAAYNDALSALELFLNARALQEITGRRDDLQPHIQPFVQSTGELKGALMETMAARAEDPQNQSMTERFDGGALVGDWLFNTAAEREMFLLCSGDSPGRVLREIVTCAHPRQMRFDRWHVHYIVALWIARAPMRFQKRSISRPCN